MLTLRNIFGCFLIFAVVVWTCVGQNETAVALPACAGTCVNKYYCPTCEKDTVWTLVTGESGEIKCKFYQSSCLFRSENCDRVNNCLKPLIAVGKSCCQKFCPTCSGKKNPFPICGIFMKHSPDGVASYDKLEFNGKCELDEYACRNTAVYSYTYEGSCGE